MSRTDRLVGAITDHTRIVIAVMLLLTAAFGAGVVNLDQSSSLDQFQSDTEESKKLSYINENFSTGDQNTTSAQLIVRDDDVLDKETMVDVLELQQEFRRNGTINETLVEQNAIVGIPNIVATAAIQADIGAELRRTNAEFQRLNRTVAEERAALQQAGAELEQRGATLNTTTEELRSALDTLRANPNASVRTEFESVSSATTVEFTDEDYATFERAAEQLRSAENRSAAEAAYRLGTQGVLADQFEALQSQQETLQQRQADLREQGEELKTLGSELKSLNAELQNASNPTLDRQVETLQAMNESEIDDTIELVLGSESGGQAFAFMPTYYEPGETSVNATMLVVTQTTASEASAGAASDRLVDSQLAMETVAANADVAADDVIVFGTGKISDEINRSMTDSLAIVGPLALLFVIIALAVAYRDVVDILLGLAGIGVVLTWTFGAMGWLGISFNQIMIAVPVLLIGLSIDYAIHIFMRHREERQNENTPSSVSGAMRVALAGVGIALVWVTATTVIGFLSNLTSPVPPIQDFGVASAIGISAALVVFGLLVPALKIEVDGLLENRFGWDRRKEAFGTGGGRFSQILSVGETAARKAPYIVIIAAVLLSAGGAYGASQVDTTFNQEDFLAEDPPDWTKDLPEPFKPGEYDAKANLNYVNENFLRQDSQAQLLVEGDVASAATLEQLQQAQTTAEESDSGVVQVLSNGEADIRGPLSVMEQVAANNETFNATLAAADTDGDGVPEQNVDAVYAELFTVAPDQAAGVIHRTDGGDYEAVRMVISVQGTASMGETTDEMRALAASIEADSELTATATGQTILFDIVSDQLLDTVIESLLITLVAVFAFLMFTYRITEGSALLGAVTLVPVVLSVTWILGTMWLLDIPFNIMTGMITSLTVGLGVAYSIHISERYNQELERADSMWDAMETTITGTGGALLGSAATTVGGFGVLSFAILPPLQQFGIITGLTIIYAFLASVLVLPSLLVVWTRYVDPDIGESESETAAPVGTTAPEAED